MKLSNSSTDSGRGSWRTAVEAAGEVEDEAEAKGVAPSDWSGGEVMGADRAGTACGSSMADDAISSSRVVAASSLAAAGSGQPGRPGQGTGLQVVAALAYRFINVTRLYILFCAIVGGCAASWTVGAESVGTMLIEYAETASRTRWRVFRKLP